MTTTYVQVASLQEFQDRMDRLGAEAEGMVQKAMFRALNGTPRTEMKRRMPLAIKERYYYDYNPQTKKFKLNKKKRAKFGTPGTLRKSFRPEIKGTDEVTIGATAPYAEYVHEAVKPVEGHYWEPGQKRGWTTKGTGNKFISGPLEKHADDIPRWAADQLDKQLREKGII